MLVQVTLASRKSKLALAQTQLVIDHFTAQEQPVQDYRVLPLATTGDRQLTWRLDKALDKGLFTQELELALLDGRADLAVHSAKDLPTAMHPDLAIAGYLPREDSRDVLVYQTGVDEPKCLASSSPRRRSQGRLLFPRAGWRAIRGNVATRLQKIASGEAEGTFLAAAGLKRLGIETWPGLAFRPLPITLMTPAAGQGAIAVQCRAADVGYFRPLLDATTATMVNMERSLLHRLGGGCHQAHAVQCCGERVLIFTEVSGHRILPWRAVVDDTAGVLSQWGLAKGK